MEVLGLPYSNTTWLYNPEDIDLNLHRRENLKSRCQAHRPILNEGE